MRISFESQTSSANQRELENLKSDHFALQNEVASLRVENDRLKTDNAALKLEVANLKANGYNQRQSKHDSE